MADRKLLRLFGNIFMRETHFICLTITLVLLTLFANGCVTKGPFRCNLGMFHGRVYDVETGEPIEGAVVHVTYAKYVSTFAGAKGINIAVRETLTDENGEYLILEDTEMHECYSGKTKGRLQIFKPGYGYIGKVKTKLSCPDEEKEIVNSSHGERICLMKEGRYLIWGLPKLKTREERMSNISSVHPTSGLPFNDQLLLLKAINKERKDLGLSTRKLD
ncbi:MAG: hypothetical protein SCH71_10480 [Desulfobulbaceae bacterium]|nr:hypothetical protein [Desulfobulbaceae bacterium]